MQAARTHRNPTAAPGRPAAIWAAFAAQGRWKNWVLLAQLAVLALLTQVCFALAKTQPDVVVVDEEGRGHYVPRAAASQALLDFLAVQQARPTDDALRAFARRFVHLTCAPNAATFEEAWPEALSMMAPPLAQAVDAEARQQRLLETYRLAQLRTALGFESLDVVDRRGGKAHLRAAVTRQRRQLLGDAPLSPPEALQVDVVLAEVPRSPRRPDGLEVLEWRLSPVLPDGGVPGGLP